MKKLILIECQDHAVKDLKMLVEEWSGTKYIGEVKGVHFEIEGIKLPVKLINKSKQ